MHSPSIKVGNYTIYDDFANDPRDFERTAVLYHYPECSGSKLIIGKFTSIACGAKFLFSAQIIRSQAFRHTPSLCFSKNGAVIMAGVTICGGAVIASLAVVTKAVPPYTIVGGVTAREIRRRFDSKTAARLERLR